MADFAGLTALVWDFKGLIFWSLVPLAFGRVGSAADPRYMQFAARFSF